MAKPTDKDDSSLKRLGGGRWQTRDERFTIEPQSGTWVVVDVEQTDDLGLPRIRGPFGSLTAAKEAIGAAREAEPAESPLAAQLAKARARPPAAPAREAPASKRSASPKATPATATTAKTKPAREEPPAEPRWLHDLEPTDRRAARQLIARLTAAEAPDPEGMARRDVVGKVPAVASFAIARKIAALGPDATVLDAVGILADGQDPSVGVRWRLVDGDNRPILLDLAALKRQRAR